MEFLMRRTIAFLFLCFTGLSSVIAQDIITLKSGGDLKARIIRLNPKDVIFIPESSYDTACLLRDDITKLQYKSGIIIFLTEVKISLPHSSPGNDSLFNIGEIDATKYYKGYKPAAAGTLIASIFFPLGLIPAIACSATPSSSKNLGYKDQKLMENASYFNGYTQKAHEIKKKKVWGGFAIGTGFIIALSILMNTAATTTY